MVLLHALHSLAKSHQWKLSVAHFNHRLRGRASNADERLVRQTAASLGLKCYVDDVDVKAVAAQSKMSVEMAARKLRHEFLSHIAREQKIPVIALAHHADDQVELFFLRLLRGTGGEGLAGMKWRSPSPVAREITLVRPLLEVSKADLLAYARANGVSFREDATNFSSDFLRNRIRQELLPLLRRKYQPAVDKTVLRLMEIVGAETDFVSGAVAQFRGNTNNFTAWPLAIQRKALQQQLMALGLVPEFELIEQFRIAPGKAVSVAAGLTVTSDEQGKLQLNEVEPNPFNDSEMTVKVSKAGSARFGSRNICWKVETEKGTFLPKRTASLSVPRIEVFDAEQVGREVVLRHWRPGDRFQPIGMKSAVKLQDLFVNAKIPAKRRRELVVATTSADEIFWVESLRIGEKFKLSPKTKRRLIWQVKEAAG